jgi:hypothetical protein
MTWNDSPYLVSHFVARLAGEEGINSPRQRLIAWVDKHYPDHPEAVAIANHGWETAGDGRISRNVVPFTAYSKACSALDGHFHGCADLPPGGFNSYLFDWVSCYADYEPNANYRRPARDRLPDTGTPSAAAVRAEDQPALSGGVGA